MFTVHLSSYCLCKTDCLHHYYSEHNICLSMKICKFEVSNGTNVANFHLQLLALHGRLRFVYLACVPLLCLLLRPLLSRTACNINGLHHMNILMREAGLVEWQTVIPVSRTNAGFMSDLRLRPQPNIKPALDQHFVFAVIHGVSLTSNSRFLVALAAVVPMLVWYWVTVFDVGPTSN